MKADPLNLGGLGRNAIHSLSRGLATLRSLNTRLMLNPWLSWRLRLMTNRVWSRCSSGSARIVEDLHATLLLLLLRSRLMSLARSHACNSPSINLALSRKLALCVGLGLLSRSKSLRLLFTKFGLPRLLREVEIDVKLIDDGRALGGSKRLIVRLALTGVMVRGIIISAGGSVVVEVRLSFRLIILGLGSHL
jgi:hypothetical protein